VFDVARLDKGYELGLIDVASRKLSLLPIRFPSGGKAINLQPKWSSDGAWIYFLSDSGGTDDIWKTRPGGGEAVRVTSRGGGGPLGESPDGGFLYYYQVIEARGYLCRIDLRSGETRQLFHGIWAHGQVWIARSAIYYMASENHRNCLFRCDFDGENRKAFYYMERDVGYGICVSPDEKTLLYTDQSQDARILFTDQFR